MNRKKDKLESKRLYLQPLTMKELIGIINNEKIDIPLDMDSITGDVKIAISKKIWKIQGNNTRDYMWYTYWLIIDKDTNVGVGFIGFKGSPDEHDYSEVGYSISPNYRRKGFATEALSLLINWALESPKCKGITAKVLTSNIGSKKVLSNCGFQLVNVMSDYECFLSSSLVEISGEVSKFVNH